VTRTTPRWVTFAFLLAVLTPGASQATETSPKLTGIYSDLYYNEEGGDLLGAEIFIVGAGAYGYIAFVQYAEGAVERPVAVPIELEAGKIIFTVPDGLMEGCEYTLHISESGLEGSRRYRMANGEWGEESIHLPRTNSYWQ
jgi:hypothetical protein